MHKLLALLPLVLGGCAAGIQQGVVTLGQYPLEVSCKGGVTIALVGALGPSSGINGSINAACSPDGSYLRIGPPTAAATP